MWERKHFSLHISGSSWFVNVCDKIKIQCLTVFLRELVTCVSLRYGSFFLMLKKMYMEFKLVSYCDEIFEILNSKF